MSVAEATDTRRKRSGHATLPVVEIFGPTVQGEGPDAGLPHVDRLVVSPKPPSSGMATSAHAAAYDAFMSRVTAARLTGTVLKIVIFDAVDLDWAVERHREHPELPLYLSAGTDVGFDDA